MISPAWIAVDWGASDMRAWALSSDGRILDEARSDQGTDRLGADQFQDALHDTIGHWATDVPIVACGMVGARHGWIEAPYAAVPCQPTPGGFTKPDSSLDVHIIAGLKQANPADVMRGEETQIAGFLSLNPNWGGVICLPDTHTKWAHISAQEVVSFQTFMTGELLDAIAGHTALQHLVGTDGWDAAAFDAGVSDAMARPERVAAYLFSIRANGLLNDLPDASARARLSGLLIGAELAGAKPYWLGQQIAVIGAGPLAALYVRALELQAAPATQVKADAITLAGLAAAYRQIK